MKYLLASLLCIPVALYSMEASKGPLTVEAQHLKAMELLRIVYLCDKDDSQLSDEDREKLQSLINADMGIIALTSGLETGHVKRARKIAIGKFYEGCDRCGLIARNMQFFEKNAEEDFPEYRSRTRGKRYERKESDKPTIVIVMNKEEN